MRADLAQFYQVNIDHVWTGLEDPAHVIALTEHLMLNPMSRVFAIRGGAPELQGWDASTIVQARMHNLLAGLIAGLAGKDFKLDDVLIEYPGRKVEAEEAIAEAIVPTIAEFSTAMFSKFMTE